VLITEATQKQLESVVLDLSRTFTDSITRRSIPSYLPTYIQSDSPLEDSYYLGKLAGQVGPNLVTRLTTHELDQYFRNIPSLKTQKDDDTLKLLDQQVKTYLDNRSDTWVARMRKLVLTTNRHWAAEVESSQEDTPQARDYAMLEFKLAQKELMDSLSAEVDRIIQTELLHYFQRGQIRDLPAATPVFKLPRRKACKYCLDLHVEEDGSPKVSTVADISKVDNQDVKPFNWKMSTGPTHPYCYCILYTANVNNVPGPSKALAAALQSSKASLLD